MRARRTDPFKGLHRVRKRLADGTLQTYCYAWRGGPSLCAPDGTPLKEGTAEFARAFLDARAGVVRAGPGSLAALVAEYKASALYLRLSPNAKRNYNTALSKIEQRFGDMPIAALEAKGARAVFLRWRDEMAATPRTADYHWMVLGRVLSVAKDRGLLSVNPCEKGGRLYHAERQERLWTEADLAKLFAVASPEVRAAVLFALWTGQRQGDLLRLTWASYDGERIALKQGKTGRPVVVRATAELKAVIEALPKASPVMLTNSRGRPWTSDGFQTSFFKAVKAAGVEGLTFHDLRGTAVTRLALAGASALEIASVTGHSERDVSTILDRHYLGDRARLAEHAIAKLETRTKTVNRL